MTYTLLTGDNAVLLDGLDENSVDAVITDPPYGMEIAGAGWDKDVPPAETWEKVLRVLKPGGWCLSFSSPEYYHRMATKMEDGGFEIRDQIIWMITTKMAKANKLKPAYEPIAVAQKPISEKTYKANFDRWGTGYINTETTRVPWEEGAPTSYPAGGHKRRAFGSEVDKVSDTGKPAEQVAANPNGRYPSNIIGHVEDYQKFFYAPRVTRKERGEYNDHPTPKPIMLMRYLTRVYAPEKGVVLDPYNGSGSTGIGALQEGREYIGMELDPHYTEITSKRIHEHVSTSSSYEELFEVG